MIEMDYGAIPFRCMTSLFL